MPLLILLWALTVHSQSQWQVGYAVVIVDEGSPSPVPTALFSLRNGQGVLVSEAGVAGVEPIRRGRIFVDASVPTGLALANPSDSDLNVTLTLRDSGGLEVDRKEMFLGSRRQRALFVSDPPLFDDLPPDFVGSVTFEADSQVGVAALTIRQGRNSYDEHLLATLPVATLQDAEAAGSEGSPQIVFPHVGAGGPLTTQILLINRGAAAVRGEICLSGRDGQPLELELDGEPASRFPYELAPEGVFQGTLSSPAGVFDGYAVVTVEGEGIRPAGVAVFQYRDPAGNLVSEAGVSAIEPTARARIFVDTVETRTGVALASPGNEETEVEFRLLDRNGFDFAETSRILTANGHMALFVDQLFETLPAGFTGVMEIRAAVPLVPITLKLTENERGDLILTTLPVADPTRPFGGTFLVVPHLGFGQGFSTRLLLINGSDQAAATGTLRFFQTDGGELVVPLRGQNGSRFPYEVAASGAAQLRPGNTAVAAAIALEPSAALELKVNRGDSRLIRPLVLDSAGAFRDDLPLQFRSLDPRVATVDELGRIRGHEEGFSTLTILSGDALATTTVAVVGVNAGVGGPEIVGVALDPAGRLYLADQRDHTILRAESLAATPELYAGVDGVSGFRDGPRPDALFNQPAFLSLNQRTGALYASDARNHRIRRISLGRDGRVDTLAGSGRGSADGPVEQAAFDGPQGVALDARGNLWVADTGNHTIRRIDLRERTVVTIAGRPGFAGFRDGTGQETLFNTPTGIALEIESRGDRALRELRGEPPLVRILVADSGNGVIRRVDENGLVTTVASILPSLTGSRPGPNAEEDVPIFEGLVDVATDAVGNIYASERTSGNVRTILATGEIVDAAGPDVFSEPAGIAISESGRVVVADGERTGIELVYGAPEIQEVVPNRVSAGQFVTIRGRNFSRESLVVIFDRVIDSLPPEDTQTISFTLPNLPNGTLTLTVQNRGGLAQTSIMVEPPAFGELAAGEITTLAGGDFNFLGDGLSATEAILARPAGITADSQGNLYIVDPFSHRVRRVDASTGTMSTVAGNGQRGTQLNQGAFSGDGGPATAAALNAPTSITFSGTGDLFIGDAGNERIRRVDDTDTITTYAGGSCCFFGDDGPAVAAGLGFVSDAVSDESGNIYIADTGNHRVRRVDAVSGIITTVAGNGQSIDASTGSFSGDGGPAVEAGLNAPSAVGLDGDRSLFIADRQNDRIRRVDLVTGLIETVAGGGVGAQGLVDGGAGISADLDLPSGLHVDSFRKRLIIADTGHHRILQVDLETGSVDLVAGNGESGYSGDGKPAVEAELASPRGVAVAPNGDILIADQRNERIRRVDVESGVVQTVAGGGPRAGQIAIAPDGSVVTINRNTVQSINLDSKVVARIAGGGRPPEGDGDGGLATDARLGDLTFLVNGLAVDGSGNVFIAEGGSSPRIRRVDALTGIIATVAGGGDLEEDNGDGGPAIEARLQQPIRDLFVDSSGNLFVAESRAVRRIDAAGVINTVAEVSANAIAVDQGGNVLFVQGARDFSFPGDERIHRVGRIDAVSGAIATVAGGGDPEDSLGDGGPATEAKLNSPVDIVIEPDGSFSILESPTAPRVAFGGNYSSSEIPAPRIRRIDQASGIISTIAGGGSPMDGNGDGGLALEAAFAFPESFALDGLGNYVIADGGTIRIIDSVTGVIQTAFSPFVDGLPATAAFLAATDVAVTATGSILVADRDRVRIIDPNSQIIGTVAGGGDPEEGVGDGGPATEARLTAAGVSIDGDDGVLIADALHRRVRRVELQSGLITTLAGITTSSVGHGGPALAARLISDQFLGFLQVEADSFGNIFIQDGSGVSRVDAATGIFEQVANSEEICDPILGCGGGLTLDAGGNLYFADTSNHRVFKIEANTGVISVAAGRPPAVRDPFFGSPGGFSGDGGPAIDAEFSFPSGLGFDADGNLLIADSGNDRVRKVDAQTGVVTTIVGKGQGGFSGDGGPAVAASLSFPEDVFSDAAGNLFVADTGHGRIRKVDALSGVITTFAGRDPAPTREIEDGQVATSVALEPTGVTVDPEGNPVFADRSKGQVARIELDGSITILAGGGELNSVTGVVSALDIKVLPSALAYGPTGDLFVASHLSSFSSDDSILKIDGDGQASLVAEGSFGFSDVDVSPAIAFLPDGDLVVTSRTEILRINPSNGEATAIAGRRFLACCSGEGVSPDRATFHFPAGIAVERNGVIFVSDTRQHRVRRIDLSQGLVTTAAGRADDIFSARCGFSGDGGPAADAQLCAPGALALDANGDLFIADTGNNRIRRIDFTTQTIHTVAGTGEPRSRGDGGPAMEAPIIPIDLAFDDSRNLLVVEGAPGNRIRMVRGPIP